MPRASSQCSRGRAPAGDVVDGAARGIAEHLDLRAVVVLQHRQQEERAPGAGTGRPRRSPRAAGARGRGGAAARAGSARGTPRSSSRAEVDVALEHLVGGHVVRRSSAAAARCERCTPARRVAAAIASRSGTSASRREALVAQQAAEQRERLRRGRPRSALRAAPPRHRRCGAPSAAAAPRLNQPPASSGCRRSAARSASIAGAVRPRASSTLARSTSACGNSGFARSAVAQQRLGARSVAAAATPGARSCSCRTGARGSIASTRS